MQQQLLLFDLAANFEPPVSSPPLPKLSQCVNIFHKNGLRLFVPHKNCCNGRGVVGWERVGTAFPYFLGVGTRFHIFFVLSFVVQWK